MLTDFEALRGLRHPMWTRFAESWGLDHRLWVNFAECRGLHPSVLARKKQFPGSHYRVLAGWEKAGLPGRAGCGSLRGMPDEPQPAPTPPPVSPWDERVVWPMIADPVRRALLRSLASMGPQAASQLRASAGRRLDATLKHLTALREAGLVTISPDPADKRRQLYAIAPAVPLVKPPGSRPEIDFGFCLLRL